MRWTGILTPLLLSFVICIMAGHPARAQTATTESTVEPSAATTPADRVILDMQDAFRRRDKARLAALLPRARGHALEPWAAYWDLKARLDEASASEVQDFLERWAGTYQEDRLRNDWLLLLGRRRDWPGFAAEHARFRMRDDPELRCYATAMQAQQGVVSAEAAQQVRRDWLEQRGEGDGCLLAASLLRQAGRLQAADIWMKARLAMEAGRPGLARSAVALESAEAATTVAQISNGAARYLAGRAAVATGKGRELIVLALIRVAVQDAYQAASLLENKWSVQLTPEERNWLWALIGKQAALKLRDDATGFFAKVTRAQDLNDELLAWNVRAALRQGQWRAVRTAIEAMSAPARQEPAWTYWLARARLALARSDEARESARQGLEPIANGRGFYEKLALEELGRPIATPPAPAPLTPEEREAARQHPGLARALLAIQIGLRAEGVREWNYWSNLHEPGGMSDRQLYAAAELACQRQVWDRCINTSERIQGFTDLQQRFPMPHQAQVVRQAQAIGLDPAYVYGLIRQESRFIMDARSHVGASGLMQIMPATARWTARRIGLDGFTPSMINELDTNIAIGTNYLKLALDEFRGSLPMAAAAYNAGPGRPRAWRNGPSIEGAIWAENVPFAETRDYVKKVLSNTIDYAVLLSERAQSLKGRLGTIGPAAAGEVALTRDLP